MGKGLRSPYYDLLHLDAIETSAAQVVRDRDSPSNHFHICAGELIHRSVIRMECGC